MPEALPIDPLLPEITRSLAREGRLVLRAPTGSGKTTRVPPALLAAGLGPVWVLEPRRIAARAAARRMADEAGVRLGERIGYQVRFDRQWSRATKLGVMTSGILLRRLQEDPFLEGVGTLVFDEFHERSLEADLCLALARRVQVDARPDLRIAVLSATLDAGPIAEWLGGAPIVESEGRSFPVEVEHMPAHASERIEEVVARGVGRARERAAAGDVLVFLPGIGEIRRCARALEGAARAKGFELLELHGELGAEAQDRALTPGTGPRVVLATNVAETSLTLPSVRAVVDTGLARQVRFDPAVGLDRLELVPVSLASVRQRGGRAGRVAAGWNIRLWSRLEEGGRREHELPEVARVDLAGALLQLVAWGESDLRTFPWFEAPREESVERGLALLERLGALKGGAITPLGRAIVRLPLHPRLAALVLEGSRLGVADRACLAAAMLAERDPFRASARDSGGRHSHSDVLDRVRALEELEARGSVSGPLVPARGGARAVQRAAKQLMRSLERPDSSTGGAAADDALLRAILAGYPDRVAVRRGETVDARARMIGGRGLRFADECAVDEAELFVCVDLDAGKRVGRAREDARIRMASVVELEWIEAAVREGRGGLSLRVERVARFDEARERVVGVERRMLEDIALDEKEVPITDEALIAHALAEAARGRVERALALDDPDVAHFLARLRFLAEWRPELELPIFDEAALDELVPELALGCRSFADLRRAPLLASLRGRLTHEQSSALDREAPERVAVPSGSRIRLTYEPGRSPVLAARIQELFGLATSPTVAGGRVRVLMHLLAPNGRPQQVTDDLESFWNTTYALVRKELRRRYPRHAWPEDPWNAQAERRPRRKS